ncbi:hypothetical protein Tco_1312372 [Tanacetum coccineum]
MANLRYSDKHNMVAFLKKPTESVGFTEIVDFLKGTSLRYALSHNPTIYDSLVKQFWQTATVRTLANGIQELVASVDNKEYTITEASIRSQLQLADATGAAADQGDGSAIPAEPHHTPIDPIPSTSQPSIPFTTEPPHSSPPRSIDRPDTEGPIKHPLPEGNTSRSVEDCLKLKELMAIVPKMKVKSLEVALKRMSKRVILSDSEDEETENQGRKIQDIDNDPLVSLVRESMKDKEADFVVSQSVSTYKRRAMSANKGKEIGTGLDFFSAAKERLNSAEVEVNTEVNPSSAGVNTGNTPVSTPSVVQTVNVTIPSPVKDQREGKAPITTEDVQATQKTKAQIEQEKAGLVEAMRLQALQDEEVAIQVHLDALLAKRIQEEQELSEQQQKRKAKVQEAAHDDFSKRMMDMINQKKKYYAEQKAKAERDKPMTQAQQRDYMSTFIKNQSSWKMAQLKKLTFEELKGTAGAESSKKQKTVGIKEVPVIEESTAEPVTAQYETEEEREAHMKDKVTDPSSDSDIRIDVIPTVTKPPNVVD